MACIVTVIVPIYHSEPYLGRCCNSLFAQTLQDVEFLFIVDGRSDVAEEIINKVAGVFPSRKDHIKIVLHSVNQGISFCRQEGHELATGKYIFHCDSDDWMEPDALQELLEKAEEEQADMVFCDYVRHYEKQDVKYGAEKVLDGVIPTIDAPLHNKLIRAEHIRKHQLRFPEGINWGEDLCMSVLCQILAGKIAYLPRSLYHRSMHAQSFTAQVNKEKYMQLVACPQYIETELQQRGLAEKHNMLLMQMKFEMKEYFLIEPQMRDIALWKSLYHECHAYIWQYQGVPFYLKCVASLINCHLKFVANLLLSCRDYYQKLSSSY